MGALPAPKQATTEEGEGDSSRQRRDQLFRPLEIHEEGVDESLVRQIDHLWERSGGGRDVDGAHTQLNTTQGLPTAEHTIVGDDGC